MGYFNPLILVNHTFSLHKTDDSAVLFLANKGAFVCCNGNEYNASTSDINVQAYNQYASKAPATTNIYLYQCVYYPIRIVYHNIGNVGRLNLTLTDPAGTSHTGWPPYVSYYNDDSESSCPKILGTSSTVKSPWTGSSTETYSTSRTTEYGLDGIGTTSTLYYNAHPDFHIFNSFDSF